MKIKLILFLLSLLFIASCGKNNTEAEKLKTILDNSIIIKPKDLEHAIHRFLDGWLQWMTADRRSNEDKDKAHSLVKAFIETNIHGQELLLKGSINED